MWIGAGRERAGPMLPAVEVAQQEASAVAVCASDVFWLGVSMVWQRRGRISANRGL